MEAITIPSSVEDLTRHLVGIERLVTAGQWERAAIVYAFVRVEDPTSTSLRSETSGSMTPVEFAQLGIAGLRSENTVRRYVRAWQAAIDTGEASPVRPGETLSLPDLPWPLEPPQLESLRDRDPDRAERITEQAAEDHVAPNSIVAVIGQPSAVAAAIKSDPGMAETAREALKERDQTEYQRKSRKASPIPTPSLEDLNADREHPLDGVIARTEAFNSGRSLIERGIHQLQEMGTLTDPEQDTVRTLALALLDLNPVEAFR